MVIILRRAFMRLVFSALAAFFIPAVAIAQSPPSAQIAILAVTCTNTAAGPEVQGEVKNLSDGPLGDVDLSAIFNSSSGSFVSTSQIPANFNPILPGQTSPVDGYGGANPEITSVTVTPSIMDGPELSFTGNANATCN
jgi:hypothetical protein